MILSWRHNYIFLHCLKTAGTSVTVSLARDLGPRDIQIGSLRETIEEGIWPTAATTLRLATPLGFRKILQVLSRRRKFPEAFNRGVKESYTRALGQHPEHCRSRDLREAFPGPWRDFFKFCVVRNPYDRVVSYYFWTTKNYVERPSFSEFVRCFFEEKREEKNIHRFADNWPIYTIDDEIVVNRVLRYENLTDDLYCAFKEIGLTWDGWMPNSKSSSREVRDYRKLYRDEDIEIVSNFFQKEIETLGYSFD